MSWPMYRDFLETIKNTKISCLLLFVAKNIRFSVLLDKLVYFFLLCLVQVDGRKGKDVCAFW